MTIGFISQLFISKNEMWYGNAIKEIKNHSWVAFTSSHPQL